MAVDRKLRLPEILKKYEADLLADWIKEQMGSGGDMGRIKESELREQCGGFLRAPAGHSHSGGQRGRHHNPGVERRARYPCRGVAVARCAGLQPLTDGDVRVLAEATAVRAPAARAGRGRPGARRGDMAATELLDRLGLYTTEVYQKTREEVILRQQQEMLELSTPVVKLWEGILALPMIGTLDSARTQVVMESLLQKIVDTGARSPSSTSRACRRWTRLWPST